MRHFSITRCFHSNGEGNDTRMPLFSTQSLPRVGKVASGASRIGFWRYEKRAGKIVSSTPFTRAPYPPLARSPFPNGEGCDTRIPLFSTQRLSQRGRQRGGGFAAKKGSQPRLAALGSPFQGKGLAWILPPAFLWKEVRIRIKCSAVLCKSIYESSIIKQMIWTGWGLVTSSGVTPFQNR